MAQLAGDVCRPCRRMDRDRGKLSVRTTDQAVWAPENALRSFGACELSYLALYCGRIGRASGKCRLT